MKYRLNKILYKYGFYLEEVLEMKIPSGQILIPHHFRITKP